MKEHASKIIPVDFTPDPSKLRPEYPQDVVAGIARNEDELHKQLSYPVMNAGDCVSVEQVRVGSVNVFVWEKLSSF